MYNSRSMRLSCTKKQSHNQCIITRLWTCQHWMGASHQRWHTLFLSVIKKIISGWVQLQVRHAYGCPRGTHFTDSPNSTTAVPAYTINSKNLATYSTMLLLLLYKSFSFLVLTTMPPFVGSGLIRDSFSEPPFEPLFIVQQRIPLLHKIRIGCCCENA